jgi:DNA ligase-1
LPPAERLHRAQDVIRSGYALRPDVAVLVAAVLSGCDETGCDETGCDETGDPLEMLSARLHAACTPRVGVPLQPMLAKPCTSIVDAIKMLRGAAGGMVSGAPAESVSHVSPASKWVAAEHKYDGQRAQVHRSADGTITLFSRKLDAMTAKYPDVVEAIRQSVRTARPFVADAEIVPMQVPRLEAGEAATAATAEAGEAAAAPSGDVAAPGVPVESHLGTFQSLSTRKRKNVTTANAAATSVPVRLVLFDLLMLGDESLLARPLSERRALLHAEFTPIPNAVSFAMATDLDLGVEGVGGGGGGGGGGDGGGGDGGAKDAPCVLEAALLRAVADGCEGLLLKRLDHPYQPSWGTRRSDAWVKCKKDCTSARSPVPLQSPLHSQPCHPLCHVSVCSQTLRGWATRSTWCPSAAGVGRGARSAGCRRG